MFRRINKILSILLVICMVISMIPAVVSAATPSTLYMKPNSEWLSDGARFAAYFFGNGDTWVSMSDSDGDGYYEAAVPSGYPSVIFCRMNGSTTANNWDNKWNQTADLTIPTDGKNCCTLTAGVWNDDTASWGTYSTTKDYYLFGFINGANYACEEDEANMGSYKFVDGKLTATFTEDSYVAVKTTNNANWYMAKSYIQTTSGTFYDVSTGTTEKMFVPGNVEVYFTLTVNSGGTLTLSYTTNSCEHSYTSKVTTAATCTTAGVRTYTCSLCGDSYTQSIAATGHTISGGKCTVCGYSTSDGITIHLVNTLGWNDVVGYFWSDNGTATALTGYEWPGVIVNKDADGYFTVNVPYTPKSGESLGFLFHNWNGGQTADCTVSYSALSSSKELWVKPGTTANADGKYDCTVATSESSLKVSPEINGTSVTFRYTGSATSVYLAGSFNDWSSTAKAMTYSNGVWSTTLTLAAGVHEYKFVVDGEWVADPGNGMVGGFDGNSVVVVPSDDTTENTGKIDVVIHYYRSDDTYTNWDVWCWDNETSGSASFTADPVNKGMMATYTVNGATNSNLGFIIRKNDWSSQEFSDRYVDLTDVISGTVHYYVNADTWAGSRVLGEDVVLAAKPSYAKYNYEAGTVWVKSTLPYSSDWSTAFSILNADGNASGVTVKSAAMDGNGYTLTLSRALTLTEAATFKVKAFGLTCSISYNAHDIFYTDKFASEYTYHGDDLGAVYSSTSTTFKVWAPTALNVHVKLFDSGNWGSGNELQYVQMKQGDSGIWYVTITGDLHGVYYNYNVTFPTYTVEATDPYAKGCGANGDRGMIVDFDRLNPTGWDNDVSPNQGMNYTDAIIYEMHIREMTIDSSSGVNEVWRGKYLGLTQAGTNYEGRATGLDHLKELGITHVQLMPVYDMNSVDEYHLTDWAQYGWGYDPKNFSCVEGSYATDPYNGATRITEFKQMVQTFHSNGINVVMDVVYNHTFDGGNFCGNKIVPNYYSRFYGEGNWSNGSGVGNDFATERVMARNMIVDSIMHWVEEYHIDGFRFDLAGLIDTVTINEIIRTVQAKYPYVIFYGEGWAPGGTAVQYGYNLATQGNAWEVGSFGFFNDTIRNAIAGDNGNSWGFATGAGDKFDALANCFRASNGWSTSPSQTINYVSCHDNYCLTDKIILSRNGAFWDQMTRMNCLSSAMVMLSQGIPFLYSGDELLREKKDADGNRYHNGYGTDDYVSKIRWSDLVDKEYAQRTDDYYAGLVAFRKNHAALRCPGGSDAWGYTSVNYVNDNTMLVYVNGYPNYECSDGIVMVFNGSDTTQWVNIYDYGVPYGSWQACIHGMQAGTNVLWTTSDGSVGVEPFSVTALVLGDTYHEESVYNQNKANLSCSHSNHNTAGYCTSCGAAVSHSYDSGKVTTAAGCESTGTKTYTCSVCGGTKTETILPSGHSYSSKTTAATCTADGKTVYTCGTCGDSYSETIAALGHSYSSKTTAATCTVDGKTVYTCGNCGDSYEEVIPATGHSYVGGTC
ncbi:MAG: type I pullulanase, partial [Oscillospiraceae bacterium]|nr:type I pullulanase [Oscillospiraceae bacterium]